MRRFPIAIALIPLMLPVSWAAAEEESSDAPGESPKTEEAAPPPVQIAGMPIFVPQNRGAPVSRLGGATRSISDLPRIEALVPEQPGWTLEPQPVLYWYLAKPTEHRVDLVVMKLDPPETLVEKTLPKPSQAGIQRVALADLGATLEVGGSYQWLVKLVPRPEDRSFDRIVGGGIERVAPSDELARKLADPAVSTPHALAEAGIWYDAIDGFSRVLAQNPTDRDVWNQRAALFEQVGLPEITLEEDAAPGFERK